MCVYVWAAPASFQITNYKIFYSTIRASGAVCVCAAVSLHHLHLLSPQDAAGGRIRDKLSAGTIAPPADTQR